MSMLTIANGTQLNTGDLVMVQGADNSVWKLNKGSYVASGKKSSGWYLQKVNGEHVGQIQPLTAAMQDNLILANFASGDPHRCNCPPYPPYPPYPPCPPHPHPYPPTPPDPIAIYSELDEYYLEHSMITVDSIADRNAIPKKYLNNGKLVRVADIGEGQSEIYSWNAEMRTWDVATLGSNYYTTAEIDSMMSDVEADLDHLNWEPIIHEGGK